MARCAADRARQRTLHSALGRHRGRVLAARSGRPSRGPRSPATATSTARGYRRRAWRGSVRKGLTRRPRRREIPGAPNGDRVARSRAPERLSSEFCLGYRAAASSHPCRRSEISFSARMPDPAALLAWYDCHRRRLPWRAPVGVAPDPYRVWLSEIMLQQTSVATVSPYFDRFVARWPNISALASASLDEVLHLWQGLGYYARARNLHACARAVVARHAGVFPGDPADLRALPGIGDYTAAAIAAIAFDRREAAIDGNVERVVARLYAVREPLPAAKPRLRALARALVPECRAGDFGQAMMDLGATICTPLRPRCVLCPWRTGCTAATAGLTEALPARTEKPERPLRFGVVFWLTRPDGAVLLRRRPERGLLGGMIEIPSTPWRATPWTLAEAMPSAPVSTE